MDEAGGAVDAWEARLLEAEEALRRREERVLADDPSPAELLALAAARDALADDLATLADAHDAAASQRDHTGLRRDVAGSTRDRAARRLTADEDPGWSDRFASGEDRDRAAGDRGDSFDDRGRGRASRDRAADDRDRAAADRRRAADLAAQQGDEIDHLKAALESRLVIGRAEGLLMERHRLSADAAFAVLVRYSQEANRKLRDVAAAVVAAADAR